MGEFFGHLLAILVGSFIGGFIGMAFDYPYWPSFLVACLVMLGCCFCCAADILD